MDLQSVMRQLKAWEHPKMRAVNAKHGAGENQFGVNLGKLRGPRIFKRGSAKGG